MAALSGPPMRTGGHFELFKLLLQYGASFDTIQHPPDNDAISDKSESASQIQPEDVGVNSAFNSILKCLRSGTIGQRARQVAH